MPRGAPHEVQCPEVVCKKAFDNVSECVAHLISKHSNGVCPVCYEIGVDVVHAGTCTINITSVCDICKHQYLVKYEKGHYNSHVSYNIFNKDFDTTHDDLAICILNW